MKTFRAIAWAPSADQADIDPAGFKCALPMPLTKAGAVVGSVVKSEVVDGELVVDFTLNDTPDGRKSAADIAVDASTAVSISFARDSLDVLGIALVPVDKHAGPAIEPDLPAQLTKAVDDLTNAIKTDADDDTLETLATEVETITKKLEITSPGPAQAGDIEPESAISQEIKTMSGPAIHTRKQDPFSVSKLIQGVVDPTFKDWGFERELSQETSMKSGKDSSAIMVPWGLIAKATTPQDSTTAPAGTPMVDVGQSLARPANDESLFTIAAGAQFLPGLASAIGIQQHQAPAGSFFVPRLAGNVVVGWVKRDDPVLATNAIFDSIQSTPHTAGATVEVKRSALTDCRPLMDALILAQLQAAAADAMDSAAIGAPSGAAANSPAGMLSQAAEAGKGVIATFADLQGNLRAVELITGKLPTLAAGVAIRDWLDVTAASATLTATAAASVLRNPAAFNVKLDKAVANTCQAIAGDFSVCHQVIYGAGIELAVNPYADSVYSKGSLLLRVLLDCDFLVTDASRLTRFNLATPAPVKP